MLKILISICFVLALLSKNQVFSLEQDLSISKLILEWVPPNNTKGSFPYYLSGCDYEDRSVLVLELGKWNTRALVEKGGEDLQNMTKYIDQFMERIRTGFFLKYCNYSNVEASIALIMDYDGSHSNEYYSVANIKYRLEFNKKFNTVAENIAYGFFLNANPFDYNSIAASRPFIGKWFENIEICGTNRNSWIPKLIRKIPQNQLHHAYGGTTDFRPVAVYG